MREVGGTMPEVVRDDVTLSFDDRGEGPVVLLIHGHTLDRRLWDLVVPLLTAAGLRAVLPDLRGHGRSSRPSRGFHWSHHAADMVAVLDAAGVARATVVGFSLGGGVALELALEHRPRVAAEVLVAPVMPDRPFEPAFLAGLREVARVVRGAGITAAMLGPWLDNPLFAVSFGRPGVRERFEAMVRGFPGADYLATERDRVERSWTVPGRLREVAVPVLVVVGEREMAGFRAFAAEAARGIAGATEVVVPDAGHLLPLEAPERLASLIVEHARRA